MPENYNSKALETTTSTERCLRVSDNDVSAELRMCCSELQGRLDTDVSTQAAVSEVGLRFGMMWRCSSWNKLPRESWESGHNPISQRTKRETEIRDEPSYSMLLVDAL
ncbi:hypothetical protein PBY51_017751 [Eleginops maclovinus]|uniref:Uncharacterized protein n=1 Tax=Eleginops maclovinus TaxID=56733 RepID=A0AAN7XKB9_ELEMC|nr:hypothetical protein PBY51_017751 [Eleginops maclovinus]